MQKESESEIKSRMDEVLADIPEKWNGLIYSEQIIRLHGFECEGSTANHLQNVLHNLNNIPDEKICPPPEKWFEFARLTPFDKISVVIIGQDPYYSKIDGKCVAHGLAFSSLIKKPASLSGITVCLKNTMGIKCASTGDLTHWAKQGILLINTAFSTEVDKPGEHRKIWRNYFEYLLNAICRQKEYEEKKLFFMLWGNSAKSFSKIIGDYHVVNTWRHPSPMANTSSACSENLKFRNCDHFQLAKKFCEEQKIPQLDWKLPNKKLLEAKEMWQDPNTVVIFTDGSCYPNNYSNASRGGYCAAFVRGIFKKEIYGSLPKKSTAANSPVHAPTNNRAEAKAIISSLEFLENNESKWNKCMIITDSKFWIKMISEHMPSWDEKTFDAKKNLDMTKKMWRLWNSCSQNHDLRIFHMRSHDKDGWSKFPANTFENFAFRMNDYVDNMATYARCNLEPAEEVIDELDTTNV